MTTWIDRGYARPGEPVTLNYAAKTLDGRPVASKGKVSLFRMTVGKDGEVKEKKLQSWDADAGEIGEGELQFEAPNAGQYRVSVVLTDKKGQQAGRRHSLRGAWQGG